MKNKSERKRLLKKAHQLADRAQVILVQLVEAIKNKQQKAA